MIIQVNSSITDNCKTTRLNQANDQELKQKFNDLFERGNNPESNVNWVEDNKVEVEGVSSMSLHNFTLQAEAMGKSVKYYKKTIIEIV